MIADTREVRSWDGQLVAFAAARALSTFGNGLAIIALAFAVLDRTHNPADVGAVVAAAAVAGGCFTLVGGVLADRASRRRVLIWTSVISGGAELATAALVGARAMPLVLIAALQFVMGGSEAMFGPSAGAGLLELDTPVSVDRRVAVVRAAAIIAGLAGTVAGGLLSAMPGPAFALAIDGLSFLAAGALMLPVRLDTRPESGTDVLADLRSGLSAVWMTRWFVLVVGASILTNLVFGGATSVLGPTLADQSFGRGWWGILAAGTLAGSLIGAAASPWLVRRVSLSGSIMLSALSTLFLFGMGIRLPIFGVLAAAVLSGAANEFFGIKWIVTVQQTVPEGYLGRFLAFDSLSFVGQPVGQVGAGLAAVALGIRPTLLLGGTLAVLASVTVGRARAVRAVG